MAYTTIDKPDSYFNTKLYTGNFTNNHSITGVGFQPDLVWIKNRADAGEWHSWFDVIRGAGKRIYSNSTSAEETASNSLISFDNDGFTLNADNNVNKNATNFASWNWLAGGTASSNTDGSITSSVSASTTSGFSIVSWTANGTNGATIGHGLGVTPNIIIAKRRSAIGDWLVGGSTVNTVGGGSNKLLLLNTTAAMDTNSEVYQTIGSSTFQVGVNAYINTNTSTMIAYCFAEKKGFSKFGSYVGNGNADGTFVYTGFKPAFVLIRNVSSINNWVMLDNKRNSYNVENLILYPNNSDADTSTDSLDFVSNGFKIRTTGGDRNASGATLIYMAFAENPFVGSDGTPVTAR